MRKIALILIVAVVLDTVANIHYFYPDVVENLRQNLLVLVQEFSLELCLAGLVVGVVTLALKFLKEGVVFPR